jgi:hypothetical protein
MSQSILASTIFPAWLVVPLALCALLITAFHVVAIQLLKPPMPRMRLRIRTGVG